MTESWISLLNPATFWWFPVLLTFCSVAWFCWEFREGKTGVPGHIVAVALVMAFALIVVGWVLYGIGALIWWSLL